MSYGGRRLGKHLSDSDDGRKGHVVLPAVMAVQNRVDERKIHCTFLLVDEPDR